MESWDVIVIGGGIAGVSVAAELAVEQSVLLIERESQLAYHTTGRSAASHIPSYGYQHQSIATLTAASVAYFNDAAWHGMDHALLQPRGALYVAPADEQDALRRQFDAYRAANLDVQWLDRAQIDAVLPELTPMVAQVAIFERGMQDIDVHGLHDSYVKKLRAAGGSIINNREVLAIEPVGADWTVQTRDASYATGLVVNCAGAWGDAIAALAGLPPIGLQPLRRTAVLVTAPENSDPRAWPLVAHHAHSYYFKPESGGLMVSPGDETPSPPCDAQAEELDVAIAVQHLEQALGYRVQQVSTRWAGLRTFSPDGAPVIGRDPRHQNFGWFVGQGGYGLQTAPAAACLAAATLNRREPPAALRSIELDRVSPARFV